MSEVTHLIPKISEQEKAENLALIKDSIDLIDHEDFPIMRTPPEFFLYAMYFLQKNPGASIQEALRYGFDEICELD